MHPIRRYMSWLLLAFVANACLKPYAPDIDVDDTTKYVVYGQLSGTDGFQKVFVSKSSPLTSPAYLPVKGCQVRIIDNENNEWVLEEIAPGEYQVWIDAVSQTHGKQFMVSVQKTDLFHIQSDYDTLPSAMIFDSLYYEVESRVGIRPGITEYGLQFYLDVIAPDSLCRNYRWLATETWEYHSDYSLEWYYDGTIHHVVPPDDSKRICWFTRQVPDVFTLSTRMLSHNQYLRYPLFWAYHGTGRFKIMYSLIVEQYGLSDAAYTYWENLRANTMQTGGLYEKQPLAIKGNLKDLLHPDREVLGFFAATSIKSKRIFIGKIPGLQPDTSSTCTPLTIMGGFEVYSPADFPVYLMGNENGFRMVELNPSCIDCTRDGGSTQKPDFWPNEN